MDFADAASEFLKSMKILKISDLRAKNLISVSVDKTDRMYPTHSNNSSKTTKNETTPIL